MPLLSAYLSSSGCRASTSGERRELYPMHPAEYELMDELGTGFTARVREPEPVMRSHAVLLCILLVCDDLNQSPTDSRSDTFVMAA